MTFPFIDLRSDSNPQRLAVPLSILMEPLIHQRMKKNLDLDLKVVMSVIELGQERNFM